MYTNKYKVITANFVKITEKHAYTATNRSPAVDQSENGKPQFPQAMQLVLTYLLDTCLSCHQFLLTLTVQSETDSSLK